MVGFVQIGVMSTLAVGAAATGVSMGPALAPLALRNAVQTTLDASSFTAQMDVLSYQEGARRGGTSSGGVMVHLENTLVYRAPDRAQLTSIPRGTVSRGTGVIGAGTPTATRPLGSQLSAAQLVGGVETAIGSTLYLQAGTSLTMGLHPTVGVVEHDPGGVAALVSPVVGYLGGALSATDVRTTGSTYSFTERSTDVPAKLRPTVSVVESNVTVTVSHGIVSSIAATTVAGPVRDVEHVELSRLGSSPPARVPRGEGHWIHVHDGRR